MEKIDFVVTWVNNSDTRWKLKRDNFYSKNNLLNGIDRYRDYGTFKYWFRSVEKFAPWVHKVYLITDDQVPYWLNQENEKIVVVDHSEFIHKEYLPTFNSNVIELNIGNIKSLSNNFVLFNDDVFLNAPVVETDFFKNGLPRDVGVFLPLYPEEEFDHIIVNDLIPINHRFDKHSRILKNLFKYFNFRYGRGLLSNILDYSYPKITGIYNPHLPTSYLKNEYNNVLNQNQDLVEQTLSHRFRTNDDISHWLVRYWRIMEGRFIPQNINFGQRYNLSQISTIIKDIEESKHSCICINDENITNYRETIIKLTNSFEQKFKNKSSFEE